MRNKYDPLPNTEPPQKSVVKPAVKSQRIEQTFDTQSFSEISYELFERMKTFLVKSGDFLRKSSIVSYFLSNCNLLKLYDFEPAEFLEDMAATQTERQNAMHVNEFIRFVETPRKAKKVKAVNEFMCCNPHKRVANLFTYYILLTNDQLTELRLKFEERQKRSELRSAKDLIELVEAMHRDIANLTLLNAIAYFIDPINRVITLSNILLDYRSEAICWRKGLPTTDAIGFGKPSWEHFEVYLKSYILRTNKSFQGVISYAVLSIYKAENTIDFEHFGYIRTLFETIEHVEGFVKTEELLMRLRTSEYLANKMDQQIRPVIQNRKGEPQSERKKLQNETLSELLDRIEHEAEEWMDFSEFQQYFSRRGFPM